MTSNEGNWAWWRFFDGAVSISASMLLAVLIDGCAGCGGRPLLGVLKLVAEKEDGVIILATLLLFPTTLTLYGGAQLIFAAKEAVERRARMRGRREGREEALKAERERIRKVLSEHGVAPDSELARRLAGDTE